MSDLKDALQDIQGVGEATSEKILDVLDEESSDREVIANALAHLESGLNEQAEEILREGLE